ncbi:CC138 protein, partial [Amia calva]|nr:CC138 protein [Amia calva]
MCIDPRSLCARCGGSGSLGGNAAHVTAGAPDSNGCALSVPVDSPRTAARCSSRTGLAAELTMSFAEAAVDLDITVQRLKKKYLDRGRVGLFTPSHCRFLDAFLQSCSSESCFRTLSLLLRQPRLDVPLLEKISVLLQKLSKIKRNKRLFELSGIHLAVQEMHRTADPAHTFLTINLNSILYNLGLLKRESRPLRFAGPACERLEKRSDEL